MNLSPLPIQKFFDSNGEPLTGGLLFTYTAGTSTKVATSKDQAGTVNTNPIVLDYRGEANVWLDPSLSYKFTLAPLGDTDPPTKPIWTVDNITAGITAAYLTAQIIGQILWPRSAAEIAASVTPTLYNYVWGDIRRYGGAAGASSATNDAAINSAIAQAKQSGGSCVRIEDGQYTVGGAALLDSYTGNELWVIGRNAGLVVGANLACLSITNSENVVVTGLQFSSAAASGLNQRGVYCNNSGRIRIVDNDFRTLTYGVYMGPTKTGLATGGYAIPCVIGRNNVKACAAGIYCAPSAEYVTIAENVVNDCTLFGIIVDAGNVSTVDNTVSGNDVGIKYDGSASTNGDHGAIVGNTVNHNAKANVIISTTDYSMIVVGNNIWASIIPPYSVAPLDSAYGLLLVSAANVTVTGNCFGNNIQNVALNLVSNCTFSANTFIADNGRTTFNIKDIDGSSVKANRWSSNNFGGTLLAGANNNDPEQIWSISAAGAPAFQNAWVNFGGAFRAAAYYKDGSNIVHVTGVVKTGTVGNAIFTLPLGFRPNASLIFATCSNSLFGYNQVDANGDVICKVGNNVFVALDGISFRAES